VNSTLNLSQFLDPVRFVVAEMPPQSAHVAPDPTMGTLDCDPQKTMGADREVLASQPLLTADSVAT
jgi:hypothetical protein